MRRGGSVDARRDLFGFPRIFIEQFLAFFQFSLIVDEQGVYVHLSRRFFLNDLFKLVQAP
ncbi:hypothetical protein A3C91_02720 [Candidatus Azambacteria bacterium RIFCSPHIGHO2_02_FULL_52_12]|nr:MAG: hypothetical protein A3C91_02720 [Candidatus Azambacteria bacterium RIFCSPHIGHO2_02_FULL_52_12]